MGEHIPLNMRRSVGGVVYSGCTVPSQVNDVQGMDAFIFLEICITWLGSFTVGLFLNTAEPNERGSSSLSAINL